MGRKPGSFRRCIVVQTYRCTPRARCLPNQSQIYGKPICDTKVAASLGVPRRKWQAKTKRRDQPASGEALKNMGCRCGKGAVQVRICLGEPPTRFMQTQTGRCLLNMINNNSSTGFFSGDPQGAKTMERSGFGDTEMVPWHPGWTASPKNAPSPRVN